MKRIRLLLLVVVTLVITGAGAQDTECNLNNGGALAARARNYAQAEDYELAIRDYTCALELSPDNTEYLNGRANVYNEMGEIGDALVDYNRILEIDPGFPYAYNNRGNIYLKRGDYHAAIADYTHAIELMPNNTEIEYRNRGLAYSEIGEYEQALADLNHSIAQDNTYAESYLTRAWIYLFLGDDRAYADFARYIELMAIHPETLELDGVVNGEVFPMTEGKVYRLVFEAQAGQEINAEAQAGLLSRIDPLLVLLNPAGEAIIADDDSGINLNAVIANFIIPETGTYTLLLSHAKTDDEGDVVLNLQITGKGEDGEMAEQHAVVTTTTFTTYRLFIHETAEVFTTGGSVLNLRAGPGLDYAIVDTLKRGSLVRLLEGPHKTDGYAWWRVRTTDGVEGWAVEQVEDDQTLILALLTDHEAIVTTDENVLNVRKEPGVSGELAFQLKDGTRVTLVQEPAIVDGFRWWKIRTADGAEGWAVDRFQSERTLVPARERD